MRLIDADELLRKLPREELVSRMIVAGMSTINPVLRDLENGITYAPVRRGRWIPEDIPYTGCYRITCSECGEDVTSTAPYFGGVMWDYCPWCGARNEEQR